MTSGFYKRRGLVFDVAPNFVIERNYELLRELKDTYHYPDHGWRWFDSYEDACAFFHLDPEKHRDQIERQSYGRGPERYYGPPDRTEPAPPSDFPVVDNGLPPLD